MGLSSTLILYHHLISLQLMDIIANKVIAGGIHKGDILKNSKIFFINSTFILAWFVHKEVMTNESVENIFFYQKYVWDKSWSWRNHEGRNIGKTLRNFAIKCWPNFFRSSTYLNRGVHIGEKRGFDTVYCFR